MFPFICNFFIFVYSFHLLTLKLLKYVKKSTVFPASIHNPCSVISALPLKYSNFLSLIDEYYNNCYITYVNNKEREDEESKPKDPTIGMTSTEVRESTWGKPDKVNKDTYSWGTLNNGYIITKDIFILKMD